MKKAIICVLSFALLIFLFFACYNSTFNNAGDNVTDKGDNTTDKGNNATGTSNNGNNSTTGGSYTPCQHSYQEDSVVEFRGCNVESVVLEICTKCGKARYNTRVIGHTEVIVPEVEVTCDSDGLTQGIVCSVCEEVLQEQTVILKGHIEDTGDGMCDRCGYYSEGLAYILSDSNDYYILSGIGSCVDTDIYVPAIYQGLPVKEVGEEAFYHSTKINSFILPDSIETIRRYAFADSYPLNSVRFGKGLAAIEDSAFYDCVLIKIELPASLLTIGQRAFAGCTLLETVIFEEGCLIEKLDYTFSGCSSLKTVIFPDDCRITTFDGTFSNCTSLNTIVIPNSVIYLKWGVFNKCTSLYQITLSNNLESIDEDCFKYCESLKRITIPSSVTRIERGAFFEAGLNSVIFENPYGWTYTYLDGKTTTLSPKDVADPTFFVNKLKAPYYIFNRSDE